jgi:hypothetical protein
MNRRVFRQIQVAAHVVAGERLEEHAIDRVVVALDAAMHHGAQRRLRGQRQQAGRQQHAIAHGGAMARERRDVLRALGIDGKVTAVQIAQRPRVGGRRRLRRTRRQDRDEAEQGQGRASGSREQGIGSWHGGFRGLDESESGHDACLPRMRTAKGDLVHVPYGVVPTDRRRGRRLGAAGPSPPLRTANCHQARPQMTDISGNH